MELTIDKQELLSALSILTFSKYNTSSQSLLIEVEEDRGILYSCSGHFANRSYFNIKSKVGEFEREDPIVILGDGLVNFISNLPADEITLRFLPKSLVVKGQWFDSGKENYMDQKYKYLGNVQIPKVEKLLTGSEVIGELNTNVFTEAIKFIKGFYNKGVFTPRVLVDDGKLIYIDEIKVGVFEFDGGFPDFSFGVDDMPPILAFLSQHKDENVSLLRFGNGYALKSYNDSILIYAFNMKENRSLDDELALSSDPSVSFLIDNKKLLNTLQLLKTKGSELFDEIDVTLDPEGFIQMTRLPNFQSKLSIEYKTSPEEKVDLKVQYSNLIHVLKTFPKDTIGIGVDSEASKFKILSALNVAVEGNDKEGEEDSKEKPESIPCKIMNILSYWNK